MPTYFQNGAFLFELVFCSFDLSLAVVFSGVGIDGGAVGAGADCGAVGVGTDDGGAVGVDTDDGFVGVGIDDGAVGVDTDDGVGTDGGFVSFP